MNKWNSRVADAPAAAAAAAAAAVPAQDARCETGTREKEKQKGTASKESVSQTSRQARQAERSSLAFVIASDEKCDHPDSCAGV